MPSQHELELRQAFENHKPIHLTPILNGHPHHQSGEIIDIEDGNKNEEPLYTVKSANGEKRFFRGSHFLSAKVR